MSRARLLGRVGEMRGARFDVDGAATIGRAADNDVVLPSPAVSSRHARIAWDSDAGNFVLEDLDSLNGTELDGAPVAGSERLGRLHVIRFAGTVELIYQGPEVTARGGARALAAGVSPGTEGTPAEAAETPELAGELARALAAAPLEEGEETAPHLPVVGEPAEGTAPETAAPVLAGELARALAAEGPRDEGAATGEPEGTVREELPLPLPPVLGTPRPASGATPRPPKPVRAPRFSLQVTFEDGPRGFPLRPGVNLVGRSRQAVVHLDSPDISRRHAVIVVTGEGVRVRDVGSRNHTFLSGERLEGERDLEPGAELSFGKIEARLVREDGP